MQKNSSPLPYWKTAASELRHTRSLAGSGLLAAVGIALKALFIPLGPTLRISFSFLATGLSGFLYGPLVAGFTGLVVDIIGYLYNPGGPYFFGFTFNAFLSGFIYGLWLYRKPVSLGRTVGAIVTNNLLVHIILNSLWLKILYEKAWLVLVWSRIPKNLIMLPIEVALLYFLLKLVEKQKRHFIKP